MSLTFLLRSLIVLSTTMTAAKPRDQHIKSFSTQRLHGFKSPTMPPATHDMTRQSVISINPQQQDGVEYGMTEGSVRAFLVDYYEDLNGLLSGTSREVWKTFYSKNHSSAYKQIRPNGNPIDSDGLVDMLTSGDMILHNSSLVSVDSVTLMAAGKSAVATYIADQSYALHGTKKEDRCVITAVLEEIEGQVKLVHEHRSKGRPIPKLSRWSSAEPDEVDAKFSYNLPVVEQSLNEVLLPRITPSIPLKHGEKMVPLKGRLSRGSTEPLQNGEKMVPLKGSNHSNLRWSQSPSRLEFEADATAGSLRGHFKRVDSDKMLMKPRRSRGLAVSSEVLDCLVRKGSREKLDYPTRGCMSSDALMGPSSLNSEPMSRQLNASWGINPIERSNSGSTNMSQSLKQNLLLGLSGDTSSMTPNTKRRSMGRKKILSAGARSNLLQDTNPKSVASHA